MKPSEKVTALLHQVETLQKKGAKLDYDLLYTILASVTDNLAKKGK
jgi:hypothetical protein